MQKLALSDCYLSLKSHVKGERFPLRPSESHVSYESPASLQTDPRPREERVLRPHHEEGVADPDTLPVLRTLGHVHTLAVDGDHQRLRLTDRTPVHVRDTQSAAATRRRIDSDGLLSSAEVTEPSWDTSDNRRHRLESYEMRPIIYRVGDTFTTTPALYL